MLKILMTKVATRERIESAASAELLGGMAAICGVGTGARDFINDC